VTALLHPSARRGEPASKSSSIHPAGYSVDAQQDPIGTIRLTEVTQNRQRAGEVLTLTVIAMGHQDRNTGRQNGKYAVTRILYDQAIGSG
jgi:hypothetical protein